jgi:hypothetical protein
MLKSFSVVSFPVRNAAAFPLDLAASFTVVAYSFSFWPVTLATRSIAVIMIA